MGKVSFCSLLLALFFLTYFLFSYTYEQQQELLINEPNYIVQAQVPTPTPEIKPVILGQQIRKSIPTTVNIPILTYHYIRVVPNPEEDKLGVWLSVTPQTFRQQLIYLHEQNYVPITLDLLDQALKGEAVLPSKPVLLTFDDGYKDFYTNALPTLKEFKVPAALFIVANFVDHSSDRYLTKGQLQETDQSGLVTIGVHSYNHLKLGRTNIDLSKEVYLAKTALENLLGHRLNYFAYPYGNYNQNALEAVKGAGFRLAVSTDKGITHSEETRFKLKRSGVGSSIYSLKIALGEIPPK